VKKKKKKKKKKKMDEATNKPADTAVQTIKGSVDANAAVVVQAQAVITANYKAIGKALNDATTAIASQTAGAVTALSGASLKLAQAEADALAKALNEAKDAISKIGATVTVTATDLTPAAKAFVAAEANNAIALVSPFATPLTALATTVGAASVGVGASVTGLTAASRGLVSAVNGLKSV
jgi:hypothetical protein